MLFILFPSLLKGLLNIIQNLFFRELCNYYEHLETFNTDKEIACVLYNQTNIFLNSNSFVDANGYIQKYVLAGIKS